MTEPLEPAATRTASLPVLWIEHEVLLRAAFAAGVGAYGAIPLAFEVFAHHFVELAHHRLALPDPPAARDRIEAYIAAAATADLYLATACDQGIAGAWDTFVAHFGPRLFDLARRAGAAPAEAEEIARSLPGDLVVRPAAGTANTRLGTYDGSGSLLAWLSVHVARRLADRARVAQPSTRRGDPHADVDGREVAVQASPAAGPVELLLGAELTERLEQAVRLAWRGLEPREARALVLKFCDLLPLKEIAPQLGTSISQASRIVTGAVGALRTALHGTLRKETSISGVSDELLWQALRDAVARTMQFPARPADLPPDRPSQP